jgi:GH15 family glucan-1,4-alpha-glucosidase
VAGETEGYAPIESYGAIGNMRTVALVSRLGSVDWCCLPRLDSASVFGAILDAKRGGRFRVAPAGRPRAGEQAYVEGSNVLRTWWDTGGARLTVTDFMPLRGSILGVCEPPTAPKIYRVLHCEGGDAEVMAEWAPRMDYARAAVDIARSGRHFVARAGEESVSLAGLPDAAGVADGGDGPLVRARFTLRDGETLPLLTWYGDDEDGWPVETWSDALEQTTRSWRQWLDSGDAGAVRDFAGPWQPLLDRAGLALKLLTYPSTGAIAAAATTSLPEDIGGERNWDYRYTWIRDASFTAQALVALGHREEAVDFLTWAENVGMSDDGTARKLHLMYTLYGGTDIEERELDHLEGYRRSRPVRIGNKAAEQFQLDIYGELLDAAYELHRLGADINDEMWTFLSHVADEACRRWQEPDYGIWEVRSERRHFVHSKLMVHVALDRALRLARARGPDAAPADRLTRWRHSRAAVRRSILEHGWSDERNSFVQSYGSTALDAANLVIPRIGFLPGDDPRVQATIDRSLENLVENGLAYRYRVEETDDGLSGHEGAFGLTTFWLIDALALSGRLDEARELFDGIASRANHVGLYSEEFDTRSGAFLGNFPQAFSHIGLINSAAYIGWAEGRRIPGPPPIGSKEELAELADDDGADK